jgi:uncharacterized protein (TIGR03435 family)
MRLMLAAVPLLLLFRTSFSQTAQGVAEVPNSLANTQASVGGCDDAAYNGATVWERARSEDFATPSDDKPAAFEVASMKPAPTPIATKDEYTEGYNAGMRAALASAGMRISGQRVNITDNSLRDLIRIAWQLKDYQIVAPPWTANDRYEVIANMPAGADRTQAPAMLRTFLEVRFHLQTHKETRALPVYALVTAKGGPKLAPADGAPNKLGGDAWVDSGLGHLRALKSTAAAFADILTKVSDRPVIDATGLTGVFNFDVTYSPGLSANLSDAGPTLASALAELGLKMEKRDAQIEVLVVDHADKAPTGN